MTKSIRRICISGGPGSGKSYLGKKLSGLLKLPYTRLDAIYWDDAFGRWEKPRPKNMRDKQFRSIIQNKNWIIEGHYPDWVKSGFSKADVIIFLKTGLLKRDLNLLTRFIKRKSGIIKGKKESLKDRAKLIGFSHKYDLSEAESAVSEFKNKTLFFNSADEAIAGVMQIKKSKQGTEK